MTRLAIALVVLAPAVADAGSGRVSLPPGSQIGVMERPARSAGTGCVALRPGREIGETVPRCGSAARAAPAR